MSIAIAIHSYGDVPFDVYFNHLYCVAGWGRKHDLVFVGKSGLDAATARNRIIERCFEKGCSHILFLDEDHFIPPSMLDFLLETGDQAIVSGLVCKKGEEFQQVAWEVRDVNGKKEYYHVTLPIDGKVYEVSVCAFGCTLINLEKLKKLKKPYFRDTCETDVDGNKSNIRSDINLCHAFVDIGEKVWIDTRVLVGHLCGSLSTIVYPHCASDLHKLKTLERNVVRLKEGQVGQYYLPGEDRNE